MLSVVGDRRRLEQSLVRLITIREIRSCPLQSFPASSCSRTGLLRTSSRSEICFRMSPVPLSRLSQISCSVSSLSWSFSTHLEIFLAAPFVTPSERSLSSVRWRRSWYDMYMKRLVYLCSRWYFSQPGTLRIPGLNCSSS